ncbi:MAG: bifunctional oligoribonuclease/PAP phosphatase NrnA [Candidatus Omnitrophica bacterium]|nr:bifunctional oligoribonuclease/PAP phosphatase NrnA [Candidatus Omnitrophota bacterium]
MDKKIIAALKKYKTFAVTMHAHPDPDAMGSALAMVLFLKSMGKKVRLFNEDPCPQWLAFMPQSGLYEQLAGKEKFSPEVLVVLDSGDLKRIGNVKGLIGRETVVVNIDHHVTSDHFGTLNYVHPEHSSTCEILFEFFRAARFKLTRDVAILLYLGILTDTGSFGFDSTTPRTHEIIAELLKFGFSVSDLYRQVYETMPRADLKPFLSTMNRLELHCDKRVACLTMSERDGKTFSGEFDVRDKIFNLLRSVKGLAAIVIVTEVAKDRSRINFRSRGAVNVARLAEKFGGGGHRNASGCFMDAPVAKAKARIIKEIGKGL